MTIDELFISLGLKTDGVKKGAKEAENAISGMTSTITAKLGVLSAAATAAFSVFSRFGEYVGQADAMGKLANALDVDIEKMHAWGEAAARAGGSVEGFQGSLQSLTAQLARQATVGTSRAAKMLEGAGIDAGEIGRQRQTFDVMMDLAEKAETMGKQEFFGLGRSIGLDQGTIMLLQQGRAALKEQIRLQKEFGVYTKEDAKLTADWNDRVADFGQVMKSFSAIIFRMVLPAMTKFVEYVNKAVAFLRKHEKFVQAFFIGLATIITTMVLPALAKMAAALLANPLTWFIASIAILALMLEDLFGWMDGKNAALADFWAKLFGTDDPEEAKKIFEGYKKSAEEFFAELQAFLPDAITAWETLKEVIGLSFVPLVKLIEAIQVLKKVWNEVYPIWETGLTAIKNGFESLVDIIADKLTGAFEAAKSAWDNTIGKLSMPSFGGGDKTEAHADGGIFNSPHMGLVAESGAEAIIPLSSGKRNRAIDLLSTIAGNFIDVSAAQALPMGGASTVNNTTDTRVTVGTVNISAADGTDAANQFMTGVETRAQMWTAAANVAY